MIDIIEDMRNEFKVKLTDKLEEEVIAFLNAEGGNLFIGINDVVFENKIEFNKLQKSIIKLIMDNPYITQEELVRLLDVNKRTITRNFSFLINNKYIERIGNHRSGYWKINI